MSGLVPETSFVYGASGPENIYNTTPTGLGLSPSYLASSSASASAAASGGGGGGSLGVSIVSSSVVSSGRSFAAGVNVLPVGLTFFADGTSYYLFQVSAFDWGNTVVSQSLLSIEYDGTDGGAMAVLTETLANAADPLNSQAALLPTAGNHTVNARLWCDAGTATIAAGAQGMTDLSSTILSRWR